jgi:hypothetical protein
MADRPPEAFAVVYSTHPDFTTEFVITVEEARCHEWSGYLQKHHYAAVECVTVDSLITAAKRAFTEWYGPRTSEFADERAAFIEALRAALPLRDPAPGETFPEWGCAADL